MTNCYVVFDNNASATNNRVVCVGTSLSAIKTWALSYYKKAYKMTPKQTAQFVEDLIEIGIDDLEIYEGTSLEPLAANGTVTVGYIEAYNPIVAVGYDTEEVLNETAEALLEEYGDYGFTDPIDQLKQDILDNVTDGYIQRDVPVVG